MLPEATFKRSRPLAEPLRWKLRDQLRDHLDYPLVCEHLINQPIFN